MFTLLEPDRLCATADTIRDQVNATFPDSGLAKVACELSETTRFTINEADQLVKPLWGLRILCLLGIGVLLIWPLLVGWFMDLKVEFHSFAEFMEATDAGVHILIVAAGGVLFLITLENRIKRNRAMEELKILRSMAHIIDMHQIAKDPGLDHVEPIEGDDHRTVKTDKELALYLDFCSDLLAILGKLAAYYLQCLSDREVLAAVGEIENLTNGLSSKLWQKIRIIRQIAESRARP